MTNNEFLLLRHAKTEITNKIPVSKWTLSEEGFKETEKLTLVEEFKDLDILISSHGIVINLHFAKVLNQLDIVYDRWKQTTFCDFGIIKNGLVVKDIAKL